jgi:voltage-gated potassium channel
VEQPTTSGRRPSRAEGATGRQLHRFLVALGAFAAVLAIGTIGFRLMLDEGWSSAFYRAVVSTTLTGLDSKPDGADAEIFTVVLLLAGVAIFLYIAGAVVEAISHGVVANVYEQRRRRRAIDALDGHTIICGFGRVGRSAAAEFAADGAAFVVVDVNPEAVEAARAAGAHVIEGDGTEDVDLEQAGLARARALVASADSDEKNLYIALSARALRSDLFIVARASDEAAARKLALVGADRVVQPYSNAGVQIAKLVLKPQVAAFLDVGGSRARTEHRFEEIVVTEACGHAGRTVGELAVRDRTGATIVAVRKADGTFDPRPAPDTVLAAGDVVVGVGTPAEVRELEALFAPREPVAG